MATQRIKPKEVKTIQPPLTDVVAVGDRIRTAVAELNAALAEAYKLNVEASVQRAPVEYELRENAGGGRVPGPMQFVIKRLDFRL